MRGTAATAAAAVVVVLATCCFAVASAVAVSLRMPAAAFNAKLINTAIHAGVTW